MRHPAAAVLALIGIIVLASPGWGRRQAGAYKPDGWQGLTLDDSTPEDAIRALGQPSSDKSDRLRVHNIDKWITPKHKQKIFRVLVYKAAGETKRAELAFLDNKLVRIYLEYHEKKFPAKDLGGAVGSDFVLVEGGVPSDSTPSVYEGQKESLVPKVYPAAYYLVSVTPRSLISALVSGGRLKAVFKEVYRVKTKEPFPGSLLHLEIISRALSKSEPDGSPPAVKLLGARPRSLISVCRGRRSLRLRRGTATVGGAARLVLARAGAHPVAASGARRRRHPARRAGATVFGVGGSRAPVEAEPCGDGANRRRYQ